MIALAAAGLRAAAALGGAGLARVLAALPIVATATALCGLALGLVDLGTDPVALTIAAGALWFAAARLLPPPPQPITTELRTAWARQLRPIQVAVVASAGALIALVVWFLANPALVGDGLHYHVPIVAAWVTGGDPGSLRAISTDAPLEAYPLATEVLVSWAAGIGRSFVAVTLWNPLMLALLALAGWVGLRAVVVSRAVALLAVAALASAPLLVGQLNTFTTDLPALAWLVCCAALCACALRTPGLLVPALLAAGLAVGTKTTALPLAAICLVATAIAIRGRTRPLRGVLIAAAVAAAIVGGLWYLRNLVIHGSPLWPFVAAPWGDESPFLFDFFGERLLADPGSVEGRLDDYGRSMWGCALLLAGGMLAPLWARSRGALAASAATWLSLLLWLNAPNTAFPNEAIYDGLQGGAVRYLLPGIAGSTLALALSAAEWGRGRYVGLALLAMGLVANLIGNARLGFVGDFVPAVAFEVDSVLPSVVVPLAGAAIGALAVGALARFPALDLGRRGTAAVVATCAVLAGALAALAASGYVERSTEQVPSPSVAGWLVRQGAFADGEDPVASQGRIVGTLAGDRLRHQLSLLPAGPDCTPIRAAADAGWVVINISEVPDPPPEGADPATYAQEVQAQEIAAARCLEDREAAYEDGTSRVYAPGLTGTE